MDEFSEIDLPILGEEIKATQTSEYFEEFNEKYQIRIQYLVKKTNIICFILKIITLNFFSLFQQWFVNIQLLEYQLTTKPQYLLISKLKNGKKISFDQIISCQFIDNRIKFKYEYINYIITSQNHLQILAIPNYNYQQLNSFEVNKRQQLFGENIMQIQESTLKEILLQILSPFNIFQLFSFIVWCLDDYYLYAGLIAILTIIQLGIALIEIQKQNIKIRNMIYHELSVKVHRDNEVITISSKALVPGDFVEIKQGEIITFDGVILIGEAVFNEAVLTGESTPILKGSDSQILNGSMCLQSSINCLAMVQRIGFSTVKGSLARYILFNNTYSYSFQSESLKYIYVLGTFGLLLSIMNLIVRIKVTSDYFKSIIEALEIFTIMIPPSLPTAIGAGLQIASQRLKANEIYCIKPDKINVSGLVNFIGFDKTGTLTESSLSVVGCIEQNDIIKPKKCNELLQLALQSCHSLIEGCGDNLEVAMLQCCENSFDFENVITYQFDAQLQRMSVIIKYKQKILAITKGSPEIMERLCFKTIPNNYSQIIDQYSKKGFRLISFGYKQLINQDYSRSIIENNLVFLGILIFKNQLREDSKQLIKQLNDCKIDTIMVTGDNVLTSINIAQECNILKSQIPIIIGECKDEKLIFSNEIDILELEQTDYQVALTGNAFEYVSKVQIILQKTKVFARMKPSQKGNLILKFKAQETYTCFVGDGCNDICALQQSDVGLALSKEEASLAAPFTSNIEQASQLIELLKIGRCSLATSQSCFKFMTLYSIIQAFSLTLCYVKNTNFTNGQFLYQDLWIIIPLAFTMGLSKPAKKLEGNQIISSLLSKPILQSIFGIIIICLISQMFQYYCVKDIKLNSHEFENANQINSSFILLGNTQIVCISIAFSFGGTQRQPIYNNKAIIITLTVIILLSLWIMTFQNHSFFINFQSNKYIIANHIVVAFAIISYERFLTVKVV